MNKLSVLYFFLLIFQLGKAQITLFSTDFQSGIPSNYSIVNNDGNIPFATMTPFIGQEAWISLEDPDSTLNLVAASTSFFETADSADRWLISPQISLSTFGNYLTWKAKSHDPSFPDDYVVLLSTTGNLPADFTDTIGSVEQENFEWTNREVDLSSLGLNDSSIYVAFVLRTYDGFKMYLDDILVRGEDASSIEQQDEISVTVYPNPTNGILRVKTDVEIQKLEIFSVRGELLLSTFQSEINLADLNAGSYFLRATTSKGVSSKLVQKVD